MHLVAPRLLAALIPPLFLVICFETGYVIHKERSVKYLGINFDVSLTT
jgi:ABC-type dipeptide/oligopeptide/nickel transport system permease subunit